MLSVADATKQADVIHLLVPDEMHGPIFSAEIQPNLTAGKTMSCSHGFAYVFGEIVPPADVNVIMVAPKSPGTEERKRFVEGFGVPGLIAVHQDCTGNARDIALAMAKGVGLTRAGVLECTLEQETYEDLFGEQNVICGGVVDLMKYGFETLIEAGYPPEMAYFECIHEAKLIVDLIYEGGIQRMNEVISNTAEWGEYVTGPRILPADVKERMKQALADIHSGKFAREWIAEARAGMPVLKAKRAAERQAEQRVHEKNVRTGKYNNPRASGSNSTTSSRSCAAHAVRSCSAESRVQGCCSRHLQGRSDSGQVQGRGHPASVPREDQACYDCQC